MQYVQELFPNDLLLRVNFAEEHLAFLSAQPDHLERIWWSDEANFHVCGGVNKEDFRYWSPINPLFHSAKPLHSPKVTVWAALNANGIVGPYFFPGTVGAQSYCQMLEEVFIPEIQNRPDFDTMLFQQDGAPPHFALQTRALLDEVFPERWIGRASPNLNWPPRSPDLTPLDFFCWGYIKSKVYAVPIRDVEHLKERIVDAFIDLTPEMVRRACLSGVEHRLRKCIEVNGQSVELPNEPHPIPVQPAPPVPQNPPPNRRRRRVSPLRNVEHQPPRRRGRPSNQTSAASNASVRQVQHATNVVQDIPPPIDPPVGAELEDEPDVPPRFDENAEGPPRRDNFCVLT
uniref:Transposase n=1 Tax=Panagrolaimus superbus TaxID=310955 RepID=A0A914ZC01_9BILA